MVVVVGGVVDNRCKVFRQEGFLVWGERLVCASKRPPKNDFLSALAYHSLIFEKTFQRPIIWRDTLKKVKNYINTTSCFFTFFFGMSSGKAYHVFPSHSTPHSYTPLAHFRQPPNQMFGQKTPLQCRLDTALCTAPVSS